MASRDSKRNVINKFVSNTSGLSGSESNKVDNMFVKVGKLGGYQRSREKSGVWSYFGELCYG